MSCVCVEGTDQVCSFVYLSFLWLWPTIFLQCFICQGRKRIKPNEQTRLKTFWQAEYGIPVYGGFCGDSRWWKHRQRRSDGIPFIWRTENKAKYYIQSPFCKLSSWILNRSGKSLEKERKCSSPLQSNNNGLHQKNVLVKIMKLYVCVHKSGLDKHKMLKMLQT